MIKAYYYLAKPGIIYGNLITTIAGFLLSSKNSHFDSKLFLLTLFGLSLIIGSGCVFNNLADINLDARMDRTKNRALVTGKISKTAAFIYAVILLILGLIVLSYVNQLTLYIALIGFVVYVLIYTPLKPQSHYATLVGSIAGAVPPVVGYTAVVNRFDLGALLLFLVLVSWQMPHFYSIAIRRQKEYEAANVPVLSLQKGINTTKIHILVYIIIFIVTTALLKFFGFASWIYLIAILILGLYWLSLSIRGFTVADNVVWARKMFLVSLTVLLVFSIAISLDSLIH
jgi:protoheme IX farnesyltransferase